MLRFTKIQCVLLILWSILIHTITQANPIIYLNKTSENDLDLNGKYAASTKAVNITETKQNRENNQKITIENSSNRGLPFDDFSDIRWDTHSVLNSDSLNGKEKLFPVSARLAKTEDDVTEIAYDYDQFKEEYDSIVEKIEKERGQLNETEFKPPAVSQCNADKFFNKGPFTVACLVAEYFETSETEIKENARTSILRLLRLWLWAIILFILIGWAHYGYLNVCCPFSVCFPQNGYDEVKRKLVLNPPGRRTETKPITEEQESRLKLQVINYQPYEPEHYFYNAIWDKVYRQ